MKRRSPVVVRGVSARVNDPVRLLNPGCEQLAFPAAEMPLAQLFPLHWVGFPARAVAVAALPVVSLEIVVGTSAGAKARKVGVAACPDAGPARTVLAFWVRSCGVSVPLDETGEPETVELKMMPSPVMPTLVTVPGAPETNMVRTSVIEEIAALVVTTVAIGMLVDVKPAVFEAGAQLFAVLRYT